MNTYTAVVWNDERILVGYANSCENGHELVFAFQRELGLGTSDSRWQVLPSHARVEVRGDGVRS